jgi:hypothetical protein
MAARTTRTLAGRASAAAVALVALTALAGCGGTARSTTDHGAGTAASGMIVAGSGPATGTLMDAMVPSGRLSVTVGSPARRLTAAQAGDGKAHRLTGRGRFVGVSWAFDQDALPRWAWAAVRVQNPLPTTLALVAGGKRYPLGSAYDLVVGQGAVSRGAKASYVAVRSAAHLRLEATYDGLTQSFDATTGERTPSAADGLYHLTAPAAAPACPTVSASTQGVRYRIRCTVGPLAVVPYVAGVGWADQGSTWATTTYRLRPAAASWGKVQYAYVALASTATLDGAQARSNHSANDADLAPIQTGAPVFAVPVGGGTRALTVRARWRGVPHGHPAGAPAHPVFSLVRTLHLQG